jgi:hypothetical protein
VVCHAAVKLLFSALSMPWLYNANPLVASSVKRMGIQWHIAVQLSVGDSQGRFVVEEELEVDL